MNPLWTMEKANLFCGSGPSDNEASNHLVLTDVKLPGFDRNYADHRPGGAPMAVEIPMIFNRLESTFVLMGFQPQVLELVGSWADSQNWFYIYGNIRDQITGEEAQAAAQMKGTLGRADPQNWTANAAMQTNYAIRSIMHYDFQIAGEQIYYWDFANNTLIVGGADLNGNTNANLHIQSLPTVATTANTSRGFTPGV